MPVTRRWGRLRATVIVVTAALMVTWTACAAFGSFSEDGALWAVFTAPVVIALPETVTRTTIFSSSDMLSIRSGVSFSTAYRMLKPWGYACAISLLTGVFTLVGAVVSVGRDRGLAAVMSDGAATNWSNIISGALGSGFIGACGVILFVNVILLPIFAGISAHDQWHTNRGEALRLCAVPAAVAAIGFTGWVSLWFGNAHSGRFNPLDALGVLTGRTSPSPWCTLLAWLALSSWLLFGAALWAASRADDRAERSRNS